MISGVGGLGHVAVQYAKAMGLHVAAIDIGPEKLNWHAAWAPKSDRGREAGGSGCR